MKRYLKRYKRLWYRIPFDRRFPIERRFRKFKAKGRGYTLGVWRCARLRLPLDQAYAITNDSGLYALLRSGNEPYLLNALRHGEDPSVYEPTPEIFKRYHANYERMYR